MLKPLGQQLGAASRVERARLGLGLLGCAGLAAVVLAEGDLAEGELVEEPVWQHLVSVTPLGGYKNNVTLSAVAPEASGFVGIGVEAMAWRPVGLEGEFQAFVVGDERHYLSSDQVPNEQTVVAQMQYEHGLGLDWTVVTPVEYVFVNQVLDVSATQDVPLPTRVVGNGVAARPAVQRHWSSETLELELAGGRQWYASPLDDTWEAGVRLDWEHRFNGETRGNIFGRYGRQWYDTDEERASDGMPIPDTTRKVNLAEGGVRLRHEWGPKRRWQVSGRLMGLYSFDAVGGYYDYWRPAADVRLRYRQGPWAAETALRGRQYRYQDQTVAPGDAELRRRSELVWDLRGERELWPWLRLVIEYSLEESYSNRALEQYSVQTITCGLEASF